MSTKEKIREEIIETISNLNKLSKEEIDPDMNFRDAGLDSFALVEAVFSLENKYDVTFPQEAMYSIGTINELAELIEKLQKEETLKEKSNEQ